MSETPYTVELADGDTRLAWRKRVALVVWLVAAVNGLSYAGRCARPLIHIDAETVAGLPVRRLENVTPDVIDAEAMAQECARRFFRLNPATVAEDQAWFLNHTVPELGAAKVLEGFDGDEPRLRPQVGAATVRQLLNHTAGAGYQFLNADLRRWYELTDTPTPLSCRREFLDAPLVADAGTRWEYGINADWAGLVLEEITGMSLGAYLGEHLFEPLEK